MNRYLSFFMAFIFAISCTTPTPQKADKLPVKLVLVSMFEKGQETGDLPGEFQYWVERLPLQDSLPFPQGYRQLRYNPDLQVLGIMTGVGNIRAAASIMGLGMDERFDLTNAYWLVAGISGVDPMDAPTGSAAWAEWLVDGDLSHQIDAREIPEDWTTGYFPLRKTEPYEQPMQDDDEGAVAQLNPQMVGWAYQMTKDIELDDNDKIKTMREQYKGYPVESMTPIVM
ncbi:MAG: purine nucleoside permease, partial [Bacteroidota bacterium]